MFIFKIKGHECLLFLMVHIIIINDFTCILILCMIEILFKTNLTYNK
jgi:hypothetical protein